MARVSYLRPISMAARSARKDNRRLTPLEDALAHLDARSLSVIEKRFGISTGVPKSPLEAGFELQIPAEEVAAVEADALRALMRYGRRKPPISGPLH